MKEKLNQNIKLTPLLCIGFIAFPILTAVLSLSIGRIGVSLQDIAQVLYGKITGIKTVSGVTEMTIWNIRLPRIILALLAGAGLSVSGCVFQSLFANPLATPDTLGVASGASFGAALGILLGGGLIGVQITSVIFGALAVFITWIAAPRKSKNLSSVVLSGIMIGSLFSALVSFIKFVADEESQLPAITYWLMGSLSSAGYNNLLYGAVPILIGISIMFLIRWRLNLLPLSDYEAYSSGVNIKLLRFVAVAVSTIITASCVSMCGQVGWVGLLIPHICRMKFGSNHTILIPASISLGAGFLVIVDTVARSISASEIPISILTAIIGAPFFIMLLQKEKGWRL